MPNSNAGPESLPPVKVHPVNVTEQFNGPVVLGGPLSVPGATNGQVLTSDANGNITPQAGGGGGGDTHHVFAARTANQTIAGSGTAKVAFSASTDLDGFTVNGGNDTFTCTTGTGFRVATAAIQLADSGGDNWQAGDTVVFTIRKNGAQIGQSAAFTVPINSYAGTTLTLVVGVTLALNDTLDVFVTAGPHAVNVSGNLTVR